MARKGINKVIVLGNLGNDPETKYMSNGNAVTNISIATSESWKDKQTGQEQERTEWHRVVFFGRLAEIAGEYLRKGSKVYIEGSLKTDKWQDQSGNDRYTTNIVATEMQMLNSNQQQQAPQQNSQTTPPQQQAPQQAPPQQAAPQQPAQQQQQQQPQQYQQPGQPQQAPQQAAPQQPAQQQPAQQQQAPQQQAGYVDDQEIPF